MKKLTFLSLFCLMAIAKSYSQKIGISDLIGTWDQNVSNQAATIIFDDTSRVRFSYKGHSGSTTQYYYLLNNSQTPAVLTVDYKANHGRNRNTYLIEMVDKNTMRLQVLHKNEDRSHFTDNKDKIITLNRRMDL